ncbi:hypothetical protein FQZ97_1223400 [compost metagenome]
MAAWINCETAPWVLGVSLIFQLSTTSSASTRTLLSKIVPLAVVRWPKPDQSSTMRSPGVPRRTKASTCLPSSLSALTATQWANSAPVE